MEGSCISDDEGKKGKKRKTDDTDDVVGGFLGFLGRDGLGKQTKLDTKGKDQPLVILVSRRETIGAVAKKETGSSKAGPKSPRRRRSLGC